MITIRCIKGFFCDGGSQCIMKGEIFRQDEEFDTDFNSMELSRNPGMIISFTEEQLSEYFEIIEY